MGVPRHLPKTVGWISQQKQVINLFSFSLTFCESLLRQAETLLDILTVTIDITMLSSFNVSIWWFVLQLIRVSIEISEAIKTLKQNVCLRPGLRLPNCSHTQFQYKSVITKERQPEFLVEIGDWITTITKIII